jgi:hypothetical protein
MECLTYDVPDGVVMPAAYCLADFDAVCTRIGASPTTRYITYSAKLKKPKKRYRCVSLKLSNGKLATLLKEDEEECFQIWLQRNGYGYFLSEVEEVRCFVKAERSQIVRLDNALKWIQPTDAEPIELPIMKVTSEPWRGIAG